MIRVTSILFFGSVLLLEAQTRDQTAAQAMNSAAAQLAARTSPLLPRRSTISLEWQNLTSLPAPGWSNFRNLLQDELHKAGLETAGLGTTATPPESRVRVTLSEDARGLLLVAEVFSGENRQIAMLPWSPPTAAQGKPRISITKKVLWTQADPILDILLLESDSAMVVLSASGVANYRFMADEWMPRATVSFVLPRPLPRDPRGRLEPTAEGFRVYLPTATCQGTVHPELKLTCVNGAETWQDSPVRWLADRNLLESDAVKAPFFSNAGGLFVMADGHVQDRAALPVAGAEVWGSDVAGVADACGSGPAVVAVSASAEREEIRVYEVANGQATPVSDALPLAGPVTALWPSESGGQATVVVRNLQTGEYEASRLGLACTQ